MLEYCPVVTLQNSVEFDKVRDIFITLRPRTIIEIGSFCGGTLWHWLRSTAPGARFIVVDKPVPSDVTGYQSQKEGHGGLWQKWADETGQHLTLFIGDSQDPKIIQQVSIMANGADFIYIDGDHEESSVRSDVKNYGSLARDGGVVAFHDIKQSGVKPVWEELKQRYETKEFLFRDIGTGTGVLFRIEKAA